MLPYPFENFIPKLFKENLTDSGQALCDKMDEYMETAKSDILTILTLNDIDTCPEKFLNILGYTVCAPINSGDSERTKRKKIYTAIESHKTRGSWQLHAKNIIDSITGYSAEISQGYDTDDWILCGDGVLELDTDWSILAAGDASPYGFAFVGYGTEIEIQGNIYINCHYGIYTAVLTAAQIVEIIYNIETDVVPAYCRVYLGYINTSGQFIIYSGGTIG
jgi:phage tail-like protein